MQMDYDGVGLIGMSIIFDTENSHAFASVNKDDDSVGGWVRYRK